MSVRVRRLQEKDKAAWLALFKGYIEFYKATLTDEVIEGTWQRLMAGQADFHIALVAVDAADQPMGLAHVLFHRSTWSPTQYCYLEDLFVDPEQRLKGIGRALIEATYKEADARKLHPHLLGDAGVQLPGARALRSGGDQVAVHPISAMSAARPAP